MESSSESETLGRTTRHRSRGREPHRRRGRDKTDTDVAISEKIDTLASTLQVTYINAVVCHDWATRANNNKGPLNIYAPNSYE